MFEAKRTTLRDCLASVGPVLGKAKVIARNTFRYWRLDGTEVIRLHDTDIIEKRPNGDTVLNSGGWRTSTTKERMNAYTAYRVSQAKGLWTVSDGARSVGYYDGMVLPRAFDVPANGERVALKEAKLSAAITKFCQAIPLNGPASALPDNGDCWYCLMHTKGGQSLGEATGDTEHLRAHIREGYMFGSLVVNAMRAHGATDYVIRMAFSERGYWNARSVVRRYLKRQLGLAG